MRKLFTSIFFLCVLLSGFSSIAQVKTVSGKITSSDDGGPLPGASIKVKGTSTGTSTDGNGNFSLQVSQPNAVLVISLIGYLPQEIPVGSKTVINAKLIGDAQQLQEVTVSTALGITRQAKSLGYAAQTVKSEDLNFNHQSNLVNALQGKVAGATISSTGGGPGQGASIRVRGVNSIDPTISGDPLYVIDGIQIDNSTSTAGANPGGTDYGSRGVTNRASDINPEDIESINILKGGAATALYGLRGANGVVVITTKKGKQNGFSVNLSSSYGFDQVLISPDVQTEYTQGVLGVYTNPPGGIGPAWGPTIAEAKLLDPTHPDQLFNNYDQAFGTGQQIKNSVSVTGGSDAIKFFSSVSQLYQKGMMPYTDNKNFSGRLNTDFIISPKFKASVNMNFTNSGGYIYSADRFGESLAYWSPRYDVSDFQNADGSQKFIGTNNPIWGAANNRFKGDVNRFIGGAALSYEPAKWLNFSYRLGIDTYNDNRVRTARGPMFTNEAMYDNELGFYGEYNSKFRTINSTFVATLTSKLTNDITGTLRLGQEIYDKRTKDVGVLGSQLGVFDYFNLANAKVLAPSHSLREKRLVGYFGEATFDYKNYLFLTLTGRNDITSTLSKDNRSFFYPSASLSYVFSDHFKLPTAINQAKLRLSYARIGKDATEYATFTGFTPNTAMPPGSAGLTIGSILGNPGLRPEFTNTYEAGLEMSFLKNRLGFDFTYYYSLSKDQIVRTQISSAVGYSTKFINAGDIRNRGVELVLNGKPIVGKDFRWDVNLNFSANRNKVLSMPAGITEIVYGAARGYGNAGVTMKLIEGQAYGNIYGSYFNRYYGSQAEDPIVLDKNLPLLIGANGFPTISGGKQKLLGNSQPDYILGMGNTFNYKNFSLNVLFDARLGFEKYNWLEDFYSAFGLPDYTADRRTFRTFEGFLANGTPNTKQVWMGQRIAPDGVDYGEGYYRIYYRNVSEPFVTDASWVRLRSASLSYNLPQKWLPAKAIRNASLSVTGNNLWLWTKYYGVDPESSSYDSGSNNDGSAGFTYPSARTIMFTLNVGF
ncbi:SusC/RagA family TonB-linked outer membrane protein [Pedobacter rhizosphaerae]|uniref:TonB-linked outer membrane protein, SusC/RagA family n=1 Tax=Pedobacter rhizosphaerae TaxID=390241 RepID=A0A1H9PTW8_9SPHI|nr:SusC/RagA family TonB-linked outer membrane protein [Pedobacter rhizosphaerae]SER51570.1 TonB-linked outer membrane protein, SusC/RagA family [Pedobacter rhizosphaerae]